MKSTATIIIAIMLNFNCFAQIAMPSATQNSDFNNLKFNLRNGGDLFSDSTAGITYKLQGDTQFKSILFSGALWMGGLDETKQLHMAATTYRQKGVDYFPGPISNDSLNTTNSYNKIWTITDAEIAKHKASPGTNATIANWPTNGDINQGETQYLAPFIDTDANKNYSPSNGDYPKINGSTMNYMIYNDNGTHQETNALPIQAEIQNVVFTYDLPGVLSNTIFFQYKIKNKSANTYKDFYAGFYADFDLGNYVDDFTGCDTNRNMFFTYNHNENDGGKLGFGQSPPAAGVVFLNKPLNVFRSAVNSFDPENRHPRKTEEYYQFLKGMKYDSTYFLDNNKQPTTTPFYGDVLDSNQWSMESSTDIGQDRSCLGGFGPITFSPNEELCIDMAFVVARGKDRLDAVKLLQKYVDEIQSQYDSKKLGTNNLLCSPNFVSVKDIAKSKATAFPNPAQNQISFKIDGESSFDISIFNSNGEIVYSAKNFDADNSIDISHFSSGIYFSVLSDGSKTYKEKFYKIR
jgi:hypothetical protein